MLAVSMKHFNWFYLTSLSSDLRKEENFFVIFSILGSEKSLLLMLQTAGFQLGNVLGIGLYLNPKETRSRMGAHVATRFCL